MTEPRPNAWSRLVAWIRGVFLGPPPPERPHADPIRERARRLRELRSDRYDASFIARENLPPSARGARNHMRE